MRPRSDFSAAQPGVTKPARGELGAAAGGAARPLSHQGAASEEKDAPKEGATGGGHAKGPLIAAAGNSAFDQNDGDDGIEGSNGGCVAVP
jgi:hypothetical protein